MSKRYWPLIEKTCKIGSKFGPRSGGFHAGQDFEAPDGTPIFACAGGTILHIGPAQGYGQWIVIDHPDEDGGGCTTYGHMWDAFATGLERGDRVEAGQLIGYVGSNGQSSGPHLHLTVMPREYNESNKIDPLPWLKNAVYPRPANSVPTDQHKDHVHWALGEEKETTDESETRSNQMIEIDETEKSPNSSGRYGATVWLFVLHTEEGNGTARSLANYCQNPNAGVSYHYVLDNKTCYDVIDTDRASWSVLDANPYTINLCFAGSRAAMTRQQWLDRFSDAIDYAAKLFVQDASKYNPLEPFVRDYADVAKRKPGCTDHNGITVALRIGNHTDVGRNFPWDTFMASVSKYAEGVKIPVLVNAIDEKAKTTPWLGKRITEGEITTPDGRGRWAKFENGYIYWTPATTARAIPNNVFETWAELGYERGSLGYPTNDHTVLPVNEEPKVGDVQAFEGGTIYRKYGQQGYWVHGAIGERWKRDGFENSSWGWPVSNETAFQGGAEQQFEHGRIVWVADGTLGLKPDDGPDTIVPIPGH